MVNDGLQPVFFAGLRSLGAAESEKLRADADRQRTVILADAYGEAQKIKGAFIIARELARAAG